MTKTGNHGISIPRMVRPACQPAAFHGPTRQRPEAPRPGSQEGGELGRCSCWDPPHKRDDLQAGLKGLVKVTMMI